LAWRIRTHHSHAGVTGLRVVVASASPYRIWPPSRGLLRHRDRQVQPGAVRISESCRGSGPVSLVQCRRLLTCLSVPESRVVVLRPPRTDPVLTSTVPFGVFAPIHPRLETNRIDGLFLNAGRARGQLTSAMAIAIRGVGRSIRRVPSRKLPPPQHGDFKFPAPPRRPTRMQLPRHHRAAGCQH